VNEEKVQFNKGKRDEYYSKLSHQPRNKKRPQEKRNENFGRKGIVGSQMKKLRHEDYIQLPTKLWKRTLPWWRKLPTRRNDRRKKEKKKKELSHWGATCLGDQLGDGIKEG